MNRVVLCGRLVRDPQISYTSGSTESYCIARYTLAVQRIGKTDETDFVNCVTFRKTAEFVEKYLRKGMKVCIAGKIRTGSYTHKDGYKVYTTDIVVEEHEFCESKNSNENAQSSTSSDGFIPIPKEVEDLPFV